MRKPTSKPHRRKSGQYKPLLNRFFPHISHSNKKSIKLGLTCLITVAIMKSITRKLFGQKRAQISPRSGPATSGFVLGSQSSTSQSGTNNVNSINLEFNNELSYKLKDKQDENGNPAEWAPIYKYDFKQVELLPTMPNPDFIFHNKLPKCGSTTMNDIVKSLSARNKFNYVKMDAENMKFDDENNLIEWLNANLREPFFLMQHHYWMNFTKHNFKQPTMINVIREPVDWFSSHYHFKLYGWRRNPGTRSDKVGEDSFMELEDCIMQGAKECSKNQWRYIEFFVGSGRGFGLSGNLDTDNQKKSGVAHAKTRLLKDYQVIFFGWRKKPRMFVCSKTFFKYRDCNEITPSIGVLEQFEDTLELFEHLLPRYYQGASDIWTQSNIQNTRNQTQSLNKKELSEDASVKMKTTVLKYETDLYDFTRALFNERLRHKRRNWVEKIFRL